MGKRKARGRYERKKRVFFGNQFLAVETDAADVTAEEVFEEVEAASDTPLADSSFLKLHGLPFLDELGSDQDNSDDSSDDEESVADGNRIINLRNLGKLIGASCICRHCRTGSMTLGETGRFGLAPTLELTCGSCGCSSTGTLAQKQIRGRSHFYDVNRKAVLGMRLIGRGYTALKTLCTVLDMPLPMSKRTFDCHRKSVHSAAKSVCGKSMRKAAAAVLAARSDQERPEEVAVSTDGTWMRRGHSSLYGVQSVISHNTQQIVDVEALSKSCAQCTSWNARKSNGSISQDQFDTWYAGHHDSCDINTNVSAPAMEALAAVSLWRRSEEKNSLKYTCYIGDGDSKGFNAVSQAKPYGDTDVIKDECIGHVQKRVGKAFRELKKKLGSDKLEDGKPLCGKNRLTEKYMDRLQNYYGKAVRSNVGDLRGMTKAIWASVCHRASTDAKPRHEFCPPGQDSWCKWQQREAGVDVVVEHNDPIPDAVFRAIKPIYVRLTDINLLRRCLRGATQNVNECFNGTLWRMCPKESFCGLQTVETSVFLAVVIFNHGISTLLSVLDAMSCSYTSHTIKGLGALDSQRLYHSARKSADAEKRARKRRRATKKGFLDQAAEKDRGEYDAGAF